MTRPYSAPCTHCSARTTRENLHAVGAQRLCRRCALLGVTKALVEYMTREHLRGRRAKVPEAATLGSS